eukprot:gene39805-52542_t
MEVQVHICFKVDLDWDRINGLSALKEVAGATLTRIASRELKQI